MAEYFTTCASCSTEWEQYADEDGSGCADQIDECSFCDRECCEDCWRSLADREGHQHRVCADCFDQMVSDARRYTWKVAA